jgi:hypothetical protein
MQRSSASLPTGVSAGLHGKEHSPRRRDRVLLSGEKQQRARPARVARTQRYAGWMNGSIRSRASGRILSSAMSLRAALTLAVLLSASIGHPIRAMCGSGGECKPRDPMTRSWVHRDTERGDDVPRSENRRPMSRA